PAIPLALTNSSTGRQRSTSTVLRGCAPPGFSTTARDEPRPAWVKSLPWSDLSGERPEPCEGPERACHKHRRFLRGGTVRSFRWSDRRSGCPKSLPDRVGRAARLCRVKSHCAAVTAAAAIHSSFHLSRRLVWRPPACPHDRAAAAIQRGSLIGRRNFGTICRVLHSATGN